MITRVATFPLSDQMITGALRTEATMADLQVQEASGVRSQFLAGYGADTQQVINLQVSVTRAQSYIDAATFADTKIQLMYTKMTTVTDSLTSLRTLLSAASTGTPTATSAAISGAQQMLEEMKGVLNAQYNGQYVFSGSDVTTAPVDLSTFGTGAGSLTTADTSYYQGNGDIASVRVSGDQIVSYGVTADNPAFEQVMRVLKFVANSTTLSSSDITSAMDIATKAVDAVATVQAKLSNADAQIKTAQAAQVDYQNYAKTLDANLTGVDVAAVTAQLATYQAQLSASFSALAKIQSLSLVSYLR
jgi:flagellar hook-associated protein 3 FlgL